MPPYTASTGAQFWTSETDFFHIISYFGPKQSMFFDVTAQDFTAILKKKMTTTIPKNDFFFLQMCNEIRFLNACCVIWALRIHPNHWQKKNWIHKTTMEWREIAVFSSILATFRLFVKFVAIVMKSSCGQTSKKPKKWVQSELL